MSYCVSQSFGSSVVGPTAMQRTQASRDDIFRTIIEGTAPLTGDDFFSFACPKSCLRASRTLCLHFRVYGGENQSQNTGLLERP